MTISQQIIIRMKKLHRLKKLVSKIEHCNLSWTDHFIINDYVSRFDVKGLRKWIKEHHERGLDLQAMTARKLRETARNLGIMNYSHMTKDELVSKIKQVRDGKNTTGNSVPSGTPENLQETNKTS